MNKRKAKSSLVSGGQGDFRSQVNNILDDIDNDENPNDDSGDILEELRKL